MNNQENYKKAIDQIKASENLKEKTIENIQKNRNHKKVVYLKYLSVCAVLLLVFVIGARYYNYNNKVEVPETNNPQIEAPKVVQKNNLPRFKSIEQLERVLKENYYSTNLLTKGEALNNEEVIFDKASKEELKNSQEDYSKTNVQVENVDEADIVKTDGEYIYYVTQGNCYIIKADKLEIVSKLSFAGEKENYKIIELFINKDKLILIGNHYSYIEREDNQNKRYSYAIQEETMAEAKIFDISNRKAPNEIRSIQLDGYYRHSRMISDNIYLISSKNAYYYEGLKTDEILPKIYDSKVGEKIVSVTDIAYFEGTNEHSFMTVAGFNINNADEICTETFFGASDRIYANENHLYLTQIDYNGNYYNSNCNNIIYKFKLDGSKIELLCKGEVKGYLNSQFSMDEYDGNLRIATTSGYNENSTNQLFVLDENLKEIGKIENMAVGERIYAVRFIGKIGYIVTFEQIDPLFVIDLSDPRNPSIKGELKIPGYSSYLHPYDETHIIGIGNNTKPNGYGGVTDANMKMSMFDVSDLENPVEIFNIDIGERYASSPVSYNHKALFQNKSKNLIGFPVTLRENRAASDRDGFVVFKVNLEENAFEEYGKITQKIDYRTNIDRGIYIGNTLYTLAEFQVKSYNLDNFEELETLNIEEENNDNSTIIMETR